MPHVHYTVFISELHHVVELQLAGLRHLVVRYVLSLSVKTKCSNPGRVLTNLIIEPSVLPFVCDVDELSPTLLPFPGCPVDHGSTPYVVAIAYVNLATNLQCCWST